MKILNKAAASVLIAPMVLAACGGGGGGSASTPTGTVNAQITDAPACGFDHVYVTVSQVRINASSSAGDNDSGWATIALATPQKIDLLALTNGAMATLGQTTLPAGQYQQIRLVLAQNQGNSMANSVVVSGTSAEQALATPSATQSGLKIIRPFDVAANSTVDLVLDFNACKSVVQQGNGGYALKPVVTATPTTVVGTIDGYVAPAEAGATVYAEQNGKVVSGTIADSTGHFVFSTLVQSTTNGNYDIVIAQPNETTGIIASVPVVVGATTHVSTAAQPITLPASTMNTVSGTVTASADASIRALQNASTGTYEIGSANANLDTGAYTMTLPTAAPLVGSYSNALPIALTAATLSAGQYTVEADAASGATQSAATNISVTSQTNVNFAF
ncbi:hypothetical protein C0Z18_14440 [Trinickia dabaoshanensis]|uniref:DUF4382 domain-containing protein n=1 Tax=Trinickia dabaoshanensis TaxID=564714 RepID=A0A2N7VPH2_9BURK|nr:DUF4382 domain-containing protein [Trinickia dabaoshanensis]PMS19027.1 hypothetical protein C0Z18_14440 [Trinickia dabaoshanensis]